MINCRNKEKDQISKRVFQENKARKLSEKRTFSFFRKFGELCFLETPVLRFALLFYYRRNRKVLANVKVKSLVFGFSLLAFINFLGIVTKFRFYY